MSKARKKLEDVEARLAAISQSERDLSTQHAAARARVEELQAELEEMFEQGAIGIDGTPSDDQVRKLHAVLAKAKIDADPELVERKAAGLRRARQRLEATREKVASENFDELAAELFEEGDSVRADFDEVMEAVARVARRWQSVENGWLALERASGRSARPQQRLDIPPFPLDVTGDLDARPIPYTLSKAQDASSVAIPTA